MNALNPQEFDIAIDKLETALSYVKEAKRLPDIRDTYVRYASQEMQDAIRILR